MAETNIKYRISKIIDYINQDAYERQEAISLSLLSALSGESIFLLGLPGVGKSMIARRLKLAFKEAKVFEYLMSRFSTPDEIFGPVSIMGLKDHDRYERVATGYLPEAEVIFLDEIWKAGPAIQNSLLTVLNEKIFLNGNKEMSLPVRAIISASNELPAQGEGLEALWDRFLIRYVVEPIKEKNNFFRLLGVGESIVNTKQHEPITDEEYSEIRKNAQNVVIPEKILDLLFTLRGKINEQPKDEDNPETDDEINKRYVSDRRWKKAIGLLKTSAYINNRDEIDLSDILLLTHILWNDDSTIEEINRIISDCIITSLFENLMSTYRSKIKEFNQEVRRPFSIDGRNYTIMCEDYPLKISRIDYEKLKSRPNEYFYGSETTDGQLKILKQGQFTIKFIREGVININSYNYPLKSLSDETDSPFSGDELELKADKIMREFDKSVNDNIFIGQPEILKVIHVTGKLYRDRISRLL